MLDLTWKVFSMTGNVDSYLLYKECEQENVCSEDWDEEDFESREFDSPLQ